MWWLGAVWNPLNRWGQGQTFPHKPKEERRSELIEEFLDAVNV